MFEKVNPQHPDKVADRIAGAIVDLAYKKSARPRIAVEVLIGHGQCNIIIETSEDINSAETQAIVSRIAGAVPTYTKVVAQDKHLSANQQEEIRCGDNGIFRGCPTTKEQEELLSIAKKLYKDYPTDGKFVINDDEVIICQSHLNNEQAQKLETALKEIDCIEDVTINPLGAWTGGIDVDSGATNRKLGSDMGDAVTGGGLHGKDLSKADVSVNVMCYILAQKYQQKVSAFTAIGDTDVVFHLEGGSTKYMNYSEVVRKARAYILEKYGSFEKFAEWGLIA